MAKCNLGKVNLEAMLVSSFPNNAGGDPMLLAGAPRDLYMQLLACSSSQRVFAKALLLACHFCVVFFPSPPSLSQQLSHLISSVLIIMLDTSNFSRL